ncbi:hypothetical protein C0Q70_09881 [Pomacea canaliculata]|uniref:Protein-serine/threonine phosphatase n=1 Tax=Pomacea canaliculata TaxID=400727 RepID=A0A2T7PB20_POMCA|nr:hypothetical protein C0Q70_09881 [Pomacea canaliculata]
MISGYDALCDECPLLCATQQFSPLSGTRSLEDQSHSDDDEPVEILPYLYLGNVHHSSCRQLLQRLGVTALLNVSTSCANHFPSLFQYLTIPVNDSASEDLATWFSTANDFIDSIKQNGGKVLVHCHAGRSRSATVCLAYLMRTCHLSLDAAYEHVRTRREVIDPNLNFMQQLQDYGHRIDRGEVPRTPTAVPLTPCASRSRSSPQTPCPLSLGDGSSDLPTLLLTTDSSDDLELPPYTSSRASAPAFVRSHPVRHALLFFLLQSGLHDSKISGLDPTSLA